jgi:hypothetical protein
MAGGGSTPAPAFAISWQVNWRRDAALAVSLEHGGSARRLATMNRKPVPGLSASSNLRLDF